MALRAILVTLAVIVLLFAVPHLPAGAQLAPAPPPGITTRPLLQATTTLTGQPLQFPLFRNQVTAILGELAPGGQVGRHQHPFPGVAYVLEGTITLEVDGQAPRTFTAGQAYAEVVNTMHNAFNRGTTPSRVLAVFFGEAGKPPLVPGAGAASAGFRAAAVLNTTKTWTGEPILFPLSANQFTVLIVEFAPGAAFPRHVHPPTQFIYVLEGTLTVEPSDHPRRTFNPGEAVVETTIPHAAANPGTVGGRYFVINAGEAGTPGTVLVP